ncbi:hypothetical protein KU393_25015, partial [Salmonella enterica subsp. enterica serovar Mbandaka]|nr:hypothetical protein [Salmonella enterica subsp. enterica serovar Mbandaka]
WETEKVIEHFGEAVKVLRMSMLLIPDTLARQAGLSEPQRQVIPYPFIFRFLAAFDAPFDTFEQCEERVLHVFLLDQRLYDDI